MSVTSTGTSALPRHVRSGRSRHRRSRAVRRRPRSCAACPGRSWM